MDRLQIRMTSSFWLSLSLVIGLSSCSTKVNDQDVGLLSKNLDSFRTYTIDIHTNPVSIFDLIEEVELIGLEETPGSLLSFVSDVQFVNDQIIIKGSTGDVFIFDNNGDFLNKINNQGNGPQEYSFLASFWVDNSINVFDQPVGRLQRYDLTGKHLSSKRLNYKGEYLLPL
ncbi:6-bladed beta-propeller [Roseivirga sp.]|uniref:6-bladed beta-propeller n=1 Tax=Roseivirga sp. TaxID=1964215 RepID=UPI003B8E9D65